MHHRASCFFILLSCAAVLIAGPVHAGEFGEPDTPPAGRSSLIDPITGAVAVGWDSTYMFRGSNLGKSAPWAGIDLTAPVGAFAIDAGAWYVNPTDPDGAILSNDNDELDLHVTATITTGVLDLWVGYTAYLYPESGRSSTSEFGFGGRASIYFVDLGFSYFHDFDLDTNYYEWSLGKNIDLNDKTALNLGIVLGHFGTRNFHGVLHTGVDYALTRTLTLSTYVAYNFVDVNRATTGFQDRFFGGASVSLSF